MTAERRYRAFISYSHADQKWARWLLKSLETWRVPRHLVGKPTLRGTIPARLSPIFADREELSAADDLRASLQAALVQSDALIVICSPHATRSPWVEQEILHFRAAHPEGLMLALIVAGDPAATDPDLQCFPRALLCQPQPDGSWSPPVHEPVAADARPQADGRYRAKMKLIAGLLAVDLDNLIAREHQRQQRKWIAMASASLVGMAVMSTLTVFAYRARNEAEFRHAQAEDLIEFMLTDLREKLEPVGRLDALQVVGEKAMAYYSDDPPDSMQADALGRRQRVMHLLGEIQELRGNLDEAFASFQQAASVTAELLERNPDNPQRIFDHSQSEFWVGYIALQRQQLAEASQHFVNYHRLAGQYAALRSGDEQAQRELAYANLSLGVLELQRQRYQSALRYLTVHAQLFDQFQRQPDSALVTVYETGQAYAWLADAAEQAWQFKQAEQHRRTELALYQRVLDSEPQNSQALSGRHVSFRKLAALALNRGDSIAAADLLAQSDKLITQLLTLDPDNTLWQELAARQQLKLIELHLAADADSVTLKASIQKTEQLLIDLLKRDASVTGREDLLLRLRYLQARLHERDSRELAANHYQQLLNQLELLPASRRHGHDILELTMAVHNELAAHASSPITRQQHWQAALTSPPADIENSPFLQLQVCRAAIGLARADRLADCERLQAAGFRHPDFVATMASRQAAPGTPTAAPTGSLTR